MGTIIVGGVIEKDGKFLLVQEAQERCRGKWNIPAGHLDPNETVLEGAKREAFEECGCKVEITGVLQIGNRILEDDSWFVVRPSGTEPKMKIYLSVVGKSLGDSEEKLNKFKNIVMEKINNILC